MRERKVLMCDGPRTNLESASSVGDIHNELGEVHISRLGFGGEIDTEAEKATIFRHEVKHLLGWSHPMMQEEQYRCDP